MWLKRLFDLVFVFVSVVIFVIPIVIIVFLVKFSSKGPVLYWSDRVGKRNKLFKMPKFRSMRIETPAVATHLLGQPDKYLTPVGAFLRKSSLDELPQLWNILKGDMSVVGPRPALFNQSDLIKLRSSYEVDRLKPGLTGWAQVNGRDELSVPQKVALDAVYLSRRSLKFDLLILMMTVKKVILGAGVNH